MRKTQPYEAYNILLSGGMYALIDGIVKLAYRITDAEYDYLCEVLTDEEMGYFVDDTLPFGKKRTCLQIVERYMANYYAQISTSPENLPKELGG